MGAGQLGAILRHLLADQKAADQSDLNLLESFVTKKDEAAFAALMERHGRLVFGVCRSVLDREQDAEDAFQATFLVLARMASSIRKRDSLANWLHGVALRTALKARQAMHTRRRKEPQAGTRTPEQPASEAAFRELQAILHEEVGRLAEKYRAPFVLCCLEGKSRVETAQELGWREGTVASRVAQARKLLESRLLRRGIALPAALTAATLAPVAASAALPIALSSMVARAAVVFAAGKVPESVSVGAVALAEGVIQAMFITKLKMVTSVVLVLALVLSGGGLLAYSGLQSDERDPALVAPPAKIPEALAKQHLDKRNVKEDAFGDLLPPGALARLGTLRFRHGYSVSLIAFSPGGKTIVYGGSGNVDNAIRMVDAGTGKDVRTFELKQWEMPGRLALSPDGKMLAAAFQDVHQINGGAIVVLDAATGKELRRVDCGGIPGGLAFSPDSKTFVTVDFDRRMHVWDAATGKKLHDFKDHDGRVGEPTFSPDGKLLAFTSFPRSKFAQSQGHVFLYETATWREVRHMPGPRDKIGLHRTFFSLAFNPDGKLLVGGDQSGGIHFWEADTGNLIEMLSPGAECVTSMSFSHDGKMLAVGISGRATTIWDVASRQRLHTLPDVTSVVAFSPPGAPALLATGEGAALRFWDPSTGKEVQLNDAPFATVHMTCFVPEGKLLSVAHAEKAYRLWDWRTGKQLTKVSTGDKYIVSAVASADGKLLAVNHWAGPSDVDKAIHLFDVLAGKEIKQFEADVGSWPIGFTADGRFLVASEVWNRVAIWDTTTGKLTRRIEVDKALGVCARAVLSADGKSLALDLLKPGPPPKPWVFDAGAIVPPSIPYCCVVDVTTGKQRWLAGPGENTSSRAFSPDGKFLAQSTAGKIRLLDSASGAWLRDLDTQTNGALAFTRDSKRLIAADDRTNVSVWDVATGKELRKFVAHRGRIYSVSTSPDGTMFATASEDSTIMLWRLDGK